MTRTEAKDNGFTHLGEIYGVRCYVKYLDDAGCEVEGTNWIRRKAIDFFTWLDVSVIQLNEGFIIKELEEL